MLLADSTQILWPFPCLYLYFCDYILFAWKLTTEGFNEYSKYRCIMNLNYLIINRMNKDMFSFPIPIIYIVHHQIDVWYTYIHLIYSVRTVEFGKIICYIYTGFNQATKIISYIVWVFNNKLFLWIVCPKQFYFGLAVFNLVAFPFQISWGKKKKKKIKKPTNNNKTKQNPINFSSEFFSISIRCAW